MNEKLRKFVLRSFIISVILYFGWLTADYFFPDNPDHVFKILVCAGFGVVLSLLIPLVFKEKKKE